VFRPITIGGEHNTLNPSFSEPISKLGAATVFSLCDVVSNNIFPGTVGPDGAESGAWSQVGMAIDAFTISSNNYLGMARVFAESYLEHHPGAKVYVCLVDEPHDSVPYEDLPFDVIPAEEIGIPAFRNLAFRYDILELNTAVKPFVFRYLRERKGLDKVFYFDPDILVHDRLAILESALDKHSCVLTPHLTEPLDNRHRPAERVIGQCGVYNLGFVGLRLDASTLSFVDWWCERLYRYCVVDLPNGLFVDQSWMDFAPAYLDSVAIIRDPIFNVAYWNLPSRHVRQKRDHWEIDSCRVGFFHFSGVDIDDMDEISRHQDRVDLWSRPELRPLFEYYKDLVEKSGQRQLREIPYAWSRFFGADIDIPPFARSALQKIDPRAMRWSDAFDVNGTDTFLAWLAEPFHYSGTAVNRAALCLWDYRPDFRAEFSDPLGRDLERFVEWFLDGGGFESGLDEIFLEPVRRMRNTPGVPPPDKERDEIAAMSLANPGDDRNWLNESSESTGAHGLTRMGVVIHRNRSDLLARYPDPAGRDRKGFAYWMVTHGARDYGLHEDLVKPYLQMLSPKSRVSLAIRDFSSRSKYGRPTKSLAAPASHVESVVLPYGNEVSEGGKHIRLTAIRRAGGVSLVGQSKGSGVCVSYAQFLDSALSSVDFPHVNVDLDFLMQHDDANRNLLHEDGFPFATTLLAVPPELWQVAIERLPRECRIGGTIIGFCAEASETVQQADDLGFAEVWVPDAVIAKRLDGMLKVSVRAIGPDLDVQRQNHERQVDGEENNFWFLAVFRGPGDGNNRAFSSAIECVRGLWRDGFNGMGLKVVVGPENRKLEQYLRHLPIRVVSEPLSPSALDGLVATCDAYLDLSFNRVVDPALILAVKRGLPVVAAWDVSESEDGRSTHQGSSDGRVGRKPGCEDHLTIETVAEFMRDVVGGSGQGHSRALELSGSLGQSCARILSTRRLARSLADIASENCSASMEFFWNPLRGGPLRR